MEMGQILVMTGNAEREAGGQLLNFNFVNEKLQVEKKSLVITWFIYFRLHTPGPSQQKRPKSGVPESNEFPICPHSYNCPFANSSNSFNQRKCISLYQTVEIYSRSNES